MCSQISLLSVVLHEVLHEQAREVDRVHGLERELGWAVGNGAQALHHVDQELPEVERLPVVQCCTSGAGSRSQQDNWEGRKGGREEGRKGGREEGGKGRREERKKGRREDYSTAVGCNPGASHFKMALRPHLSGLATTCSATWNLQRHFPSFTKSKKRTQGKMKGRKAGKEGKRRKEGRKEGKGRAKLVAGGEAHLGWCRLPSWLRRSPRASSWGVRRRRRAGGPRMGHAEALPGIPQRSPGAPHGLPALASTPPHPFDLTLAGELKSNPGCRTGGFSFKGITRRPGSRLLLPREKSALNGSL